MLGSQRGKLVGRDADRPVTAETAFDRRQEGLGFSHQIAATAALVSLVTIVRHIGKRALRHDAIDRDHEQMRARSLGEVDGAVIEHAIQDIEIPNLVATTKSARQGSVDDRELDVRQLR
jgi:hypothetical protein